MKWHFIPSHSGLGKRGDRYARRAQRQYLSETISSERPKVITVKFSDVNYDVTPYFYPGESPESLELGKN